jgi:hypothetical protein
VPLAGGVRRGGHGRVLDAGEGPERGLHLACLDPEAADLYLEVLPAEVDEESVGPEPSEVSRAEDPLRPSIRIGAEPLPRQLLTPPVAEGEVAAPDRDLPRLAGSHLAVALVEKADRNLFDDAPHRDGPLADRRGGVDEVARDDAGLGAGVADPEATGRLEMSLEELHVFPADRVASEPDVPDEREPLPPAERLHEGAEDRRHRVVNGDLLVPDPVPESGQPLRLDIEGEEGGPVQKSLEHPRPLSAPGGGHEEDPVVLGYPVPPGVLAAPQRTFRWLLATPLGRPVEPDV